METSDEIIGRAWRDGIMRGAAERSGIGDVTEGPLVGQLVYVFAQLGERSCADAVMKAELQAELGKGRRAIDELPDSGG